jgi:two-component system chemotaxis response regulator CheY
MWKVLIVEDNAANRELLIEILREHAVCDVACDGREGYETYAVALQNKNPYDVILCDIAMPVMDGLQLLSLIREEENKAGVMRVDGIPIIMVTAHKEPFMDAFKRGCDDYILKPVSSAQLLVKIKAKVCWRETRDKI